MARGNHFQNRTILITGASSGIGAATARAFAAEGARLLLMARRVEELESLAAELREAHGTDCIVQRCDVGSAEDVTSILFPFAERHCPDIAVINAGMGQFGPFAVTAWDDVTTLLRVNVEGALATARAVLPGMLRRRAGSLIFISSVLGKRAIPWNAVYCASKQALFGFADALRLEVREAGVHVGVVAPARTATQFFDSMTYTVPQTRRRSVPEQTAESVARLVLHCAHRRRRECVASASGKLYAFVGYHFPRITDAVFRRAVIAPESHGHPNASPADPL